jgi:hypothetical protein
VSAALTHSGPRVSAEFRGLTRLFRDRVRAVDMQFEQALVAVLAPLRERLKRHPRLREEQVKIAVLTYRREIPTEFRLGELTITPDRDCFEVRETKLIATWFNAVAWGDDDQREPGVALAKYLLKLEHGRLKIGWTPIALVSAHALGQYVERTGNRAHASLVADLAVLADAGADGDHIAVGDGWWVGGSVFVRGKNGIVSSRAIRTYRT